jgi:hypothetical protein
LPLFDEFLKKPYLAAEQPSTATRDVQNTPAKQSRVYGIRTGPQNRKHTTVHNEMGDVILVGCRMHGEDAQFNK